MSFKLTIIFCILALISSVCMISVKNPVHAILCLILVFCNVSFVLIMWGVEFIAIIFLVVYVGAIAVLFLFVVMMLNIKIVELNDTLWRYVPIGLAFGFFIFLELSYLVFGNNLFYFLPKLLINNFEASSVIFPFYMEFIYVPQYFNIYEKILDFSYYSNSWSYLTNFNSVYIANFTIFIPEEKFILVLSNLDNFLKNVFLFFDYYSYSESKSNVELLGWFFYTYSFIIFFILGLILLVAMVGSIVLILNQNINVKRQVIFNQVSKNVKNSIYLKVLK